MSKYRQCFGHGNHHYALVDRNLLLRLSLDICGESRRGTLGLRILLSLTARTDNTDFPAEQGHGRSQQHRVEHIQDAAEAS